MPRRARRPSATGYYHVLARGHNRQAIFQDAEDYQRYLALLATLTARFPLRCHHGCLMPNHVGGPEHFRECRIQVSERPEMAPQGATYTAPR